MERIDEIIRLEKEADQAEDEASDLRWEAARLMSEELQTGKSMRQLAMEIGNSHQHVFRYTTAWKRYAGVTAEQRPKFSEATNEANPRGATISARAAQASVTASDNSGWEPHRAEEEEGGTLAHRLVRIASDAVDRLEPWSVRSLLTDEDADVLRSMPERILRLLERPASVRHH